MQTVFTLLALAAAAAAAAAPRAEALRDTPSAVTAVTSEQLENLSSTRSLASVLERLDCPPKTVPGLALPRSNLVIDGVAVDRNTPRDLTCIQPDDIRMIDVVREHNAARAVYGSQPLVWDPLLVRGARDYAGQLSVRGLVHAPREGRRDIRENLLQSLPGQRTPTQMVRVWVDEQRYFIPGEFPNISSTGDWFPVGHYTQVIWPKTTRLGCAIHADIRFEWLVCRYSPPGNQDGYVLPPPRPLTVLHPRHVVGSTPSMPQPRQAVGQGPAIANQDGIAPANSSTPAIPLPPRLRIGGGMTQIDPPAPPPPTARDEAPEGNEAKHPLVGYFSEAQARHSAAVDCGDKLMVQIELSRMRYAIEELRKRLRDATQAGPFSAVKPADVQKQIDDLEKKLQEAEQRRPGTACPAMPQMRSVVGQPAN